jgi:hypothetical protein
MDEYCFSVGSNNIQLSQRVALSSLDALALIEVCSDVVPLLVNRG